jgi:hypothetical protein
MALAEYANGTAILVTVLLNSFIAVYTGISRLKLYQLNTLIY